MKTLKEALMILVSSALVLIGGAMALVSLSVYFLFWSGRLQPIAGLADSLHLGFYVFPFLIFMLVAGICLMITGILVGMVRLCRKLNKKTASTKV
jgi:heme/copper-type cytochrome/quinol oxidase subunit 2